MRLFWTSFRGLCINWNSFPQKGTFAALCGYTSKYNHNLTVQGCAKKNHVENDDKRWSGSHLTTLILSSQPNAYNSTTYGILLASYGHCLKTIHRSHTCLRFIDPYTARHCLPGGAPHSHLLPAVLHGRLKPPTGDVGMSWHTCNTNLPETQITLITLTLKRKTMQNL